MECRVYIVRLTVMIWEGISDNSIKDPVGKGSIRVLYGIQKGLGVWGFRGED